MIKEVIERSGPLLNYLGNGPLSINPKKLISTPKKELSQIIEPLKTQETPTKLRVGLFLGGRDEAERLRTLITNDDFDCVFLCHGNEWLNFITQHFAKKALKTINLKGATCTRVEIQLALEILHDIQQEFPSIKSIELVPVSTNGYGEHSEIESVINAYQDKITGLTWKLKLVPIDKADRPPNIDGSNMATLKKELIIKPGKIHRFTQIPGKAWLLEQRYTLKPTDIPTILVQAKAAEIPRDKIQEFLRQQFGTTIPPKSGGNPMINFLNHAFP